VLIAAGGALFVALTMRRPQSARAAPAAPAAVPPRGRISRAVDG
jgi:hypothetical protein